MNATPITKNVGRTVPAVSIGCQAGNRCCLNALSVWNQIKIIYTYMYIIYVCVIYAYYIHFI